MSFRTALLRTGYVLSLVLTGCPTDPRELEFGSAQGNADSPGPPAAGTGGAEAGAAPIADAGEPALPTGGTTSAGGTNSTGGSTSPSAGEASGGESPSQSGSSSGGTTNSGGGGAASSGGTSSGGGAGGSAGGPADSGPCGDLDLNGVQDCDETIANNARFDTSAASWVAEPSVTQLWRTEDARGVAGSGALGLTFTTTGNGGNAWGLAAASQCQAAWSEDTLVVGARVMVPQGQAGGRAQMELAFFDNDGCTGTVLSSQTAALSSATGAWQPLHKKVQVPPGTRSALLRLAAVKPGTQASLEVRFDDVLFRKN
jgi:hypothetical protein